MGSFGNGFARGLEQHRLEAIAEILEVVGGEVGVELGADFVPLLPQLFLEHLRVDAHDHVAEHGDEAAVGVVGEALVAGALGQPVDGLVVEAQVEDGVHHARHGEHGAGADGEEQRVLGIAQGLAGELLQGLEVLR